MCATLATAMVAFAPASFLDFWIRLTILATKAVGFLSGIAVSDAADILTVNGFQMRIITECTAVHYILILASAILLYSRHSLSYRLTGLLAATVIIIIVNASRLIIIGVIGSISYDVFVIVHDYLWVAAFSLVILGIWIVWAEKRFVLTRQLILQSGAAVLSCTVVYGLLLLAMPFYGAIMAKVTSPAFKALISDPQASITFNGQMMIYRHAGGTFGSNFATDLMVIAIYFGLFLSAGNNGKLSLKRAVPGIMLIFCINAGTIAIGGALNVTSGSNCAIFEWTAHGVLLLSGLLWWILRSVPGQAEGKINIPGQALSIQSEIPENSPR